MAEETSSLRTAVDKIMDWDGTEAPATETPGVLEPTDPTASLSTTVNLSNEVPAVAEDPFSLQLAEMQALNAELAAQIAASSTALPLTAAPAPVAAAPAPVSTYKPYVPPPPKPAPAPLPKPGYGAGDAGYTYNSALNTNPYSSTNVGPGYGAGSKGYGYDAYYSMNPYSKK